MTEHRLDAAPYLAFLEHAYGLQAASASWLGSNEDLNLRVVEASGAAWVAKFARQEADASVCAAQLAAIAGLATTGGLRAPAVRPRLDGALLGAAEVDGGRLAWVLEYLPGRLMTGDPVPPPGFAAALGVTVARSVLALGGVPGRHLDAGGTWDLRLAPQVADRCLPLLDDRERATVAAALDTAWERIGPLAARLPVQVIHGDLSGDNLVLDGDDAVAGVIDFGDLGLGWRVGELAVAMASLLHHDGDAIGLALAAAAACEAELAAAGASLTDDELAALWPLVTARAAVLVASAGEVAAQEPDNAYAAARRPLERRVLERATSLGFDEAGLLLRHALGRLRADARAAAGPALAPMLGTAPVLVDAGVEAPVHDGGAFASDLAVGEALRAAAAATPGGLAATRHMEARLGPWTLAGDLPRSVPLGVHVAGAPGTVLIAPADGTLRRGGAAGDTLLLALASGAAVTLDGATPVAPLDQEGRSGEPLAAIGASGIVWLQVHADADALAPRWVHAGREAAWLAICPDPAPLLGLASTAPAARDPGALLATRGASVASVQEFYYAHPPRIERGWRHQLIDAEGRGYLDMINNVAILGHGEPRIADAVEAQLRRLNTNSRFHYGAIAEFSARLAALAPAGLDVVFLVNSGSEAVDLALRIVRAVTGRPDVLALTEAYHGWTLGADAVSTSLGDNPQALGTRPEWVHLLDAPNTYRGRHRGADAHRYLDDALARIAELDTAGVSLAGLIAEPIFGNGGGVLLPEGYLAGLYGAVRERGGLAVSDEVQVSYGRLGRHFWGFEQQGAVPDVIAVAKAMGNGHPLGAVITSREVAEAFAVEGSFFSSAGGSPVSCVVGSTVLDVLEGDGLQANAERIGTLLRGGLVALGERFPQLGAVHGMGLYLGVEVVDGGPDAPDPLAAKQICEAMLAEGVIVQPTGDHKNVLKIKPPMTIDADAVARFLAALERVMERRQARQAL